MPRSSQPRESGYALLFIFLTVAIIGITLYAAMPRIAFEAQRDQEQLLVDRGEQYKRAIQVYFRKFKKYPAKIDDLENTSNQRFLRQRYVDPMTGKDEWRPIHVGPNGVFIDSLTQKNNQKKKDASSVNNFITELKAIGNSADPADAQVNIGLRRRPSDQPGGAPVDNPGANNPALNGPGLNNPAPNNAAPNNAGPNNGQLNNIDPALLNNLPQTQNETDVDTPLIQGPDVTGELSESPADFPNTAGLPNNNNLPAGVAIAGRGSINNPALWGRPGPNGQGSAGTDVIRNLLTSPRPGGPPPGVFGANEINDVGFIGQPNGANGLGGNAMGTPLPQPGAVTDVNGNNPLGFNGSNGSSNRLPGFPGNTPNGASATDGGNTRNVGLPPNGSAGGGLTVGGGIAGFASKSERPGIKIYNEHTKYNEWEFIYDYAKDKTMGGGQQQQLPSNPSPLPPKTPPSQ